jgi:hypothetical protein
MTLFALTPRALLLFDQGAFSKKVEEKQHHDQSKRKSKK